MLLPPFLVLLYIYIVASRSRYILEEHGRGGKGWERSCEKEESIADAEMILFERWLPNSIASAEAVRYIVYTGYKAMGRREGGRVRHWQKLVAGCRHVRSILHRRRCSLFSRQATSVYTMAYRLSLPPPFWWWSSIYSFFIPLLFFDPFYSP